MNHADSFRTSYADNSRANSTDVFSGSNSADNAAGSSVSGGAQRGPTEASMPVSDADYGGGSFPQGPLLAKALMEIGAGVEAARLRRQGHLDGAKALAVVWLALVVGGIATSSTHPLGYLARAMTYLLGGLLSAVGSTMFLAFWFSSTEELQGLKEVHQAAKNYDRHLPMEEAFTSGGFDMSQLSSYMEQHFR